MRRKRIKISPFLSKLYEIVSASDNKKVIKWNDKGDSFQIVNFPFFCNDILPKYFKHKNFASFVRQLNMYDFHKRKSSPSIQEFSNVNFIKGKNLLLKDIKRKVLIDNDKEYYQPYKRIRKLSEVEEIPSIVTIMQKDNENNESELNEKITKANENIKTIEDYCEKITLQNKEVKEEIKHMKLKEKEREKFLFDIIGEYEGVEYDSFRKKKLVNKKNLLVEIFNRMKTEGKFNYEFDDVMKMLYEKKNNEEDNKNADKQEDCKDNKKKRPILINHNNDNNIGEIKKTLRKKLKDIIDECHLKQKTNRDNDDNNNNDINYRNNSRRESNNYPQIEIRINKSNLNFSIDSDD